MNPLATTDELFFTQSGLDRGRVEHLTEEALNGADDGEMYLEYSQSEALSFDDGKLKSASFDTTQGFGLRAVKGEAAGYAHASELSRRGDAPGRDDREGGPWRAGRQAGRRRPPAPTAGSMSRTTPSAGCDFAVKTKLLGEIDAYVRAKDPRVRQVMVSLERQLAGDPDPARRGPSRRRHPPAGAPQRQRGGGRERPHGDRQPRHRRAHRL